MEQIIREFHRRAMFVRRNVPDADTHLHEDLEVVLVKKGRCLAWCDGRQYAMEQGNIFLAFPNQVHRYENGEEGEYLVLVMNPARLLYHKAVFDSGAPKEAVCSGSKELTELLEIAYVEFRKDRDSCVADGYLTAFFGKVLKYYDIEKSSLSRDCTSNILQYCTQHYREDISVSHLSERLHISRSHISHTFGRRLGISFSDYISSLRLNEAVMLLENPSLSVTEISGAVGFSTIRTFNRAFLKRFGMTPTAYRKQRLG